MGDCYSGRGMSNLEDTAVQLQRRLEKRLTAEVVLNEG